MQILLTRMQNPLHRTRYSSDDINQKDPPLPITEDSLKNIDLFAKQLADRVQGCFDLAEGSASWNTKPGTQPLLMRGA